MAIVKAPLKTDAAGKCTRWRVILYNPAKHKQEWHTVNGTRRDAEAYERGAEDPTGERRLHREARAPHVRGGRRDVPQGTAGAEPEHEHRRVLRDRAQLTRSRPSARTRSGRSGAQTSRST